MTTNIQKQQLLTSNPQLKYTKESPIVHSTSHAMYSITKGPRFDNNKPNCSRAYYAKQVSTNNTNMAKGFTQGKRNMIIALGTTDNKNDQYYDPKTASSVKNFKSLASGPMRLPQYVHLKKSSKNRR